MASCTIVSSRWVAGLSTGMRAFSASATVMRADEREPKETRKLTCVSMKSATVDSWVEPATRATVKTIMIMAGSASEANIISRLEPMPPKRGPHVHADERQEEPCRAQQRRDGDQDRLPS